MEKVHFQFACQEDWNKMTPTEKGAFCGKCTKQVYDFTGKSTREINRTLLDLKGQEICGRMTISQETQLNAEFSRWLETNQTNFLKLFMMALLIVFGLALFSCKDERDQNRIAYTQSVLNKIIREKTVTEEKTPEKESHPGLKSAETLEGVAPIIQEHPVEALLQIDKTVTQYETVETETHHVTSGVLYVHDLYTVYLEETTPVETDVNDILYPTTFNAIAFPNPATESTTFEFQVPTEETALIRLFDTSGKLIRDLHAGKIPRGTFRQVVDLHDLNSDMYLIIVQSESFRETIRIIKN